MRKILPILALLLVAFLLFAFQKHEVFVVVSGKVTYQGQGLESVQVAVVKEKDDRLDWRLMSKYTEPTSRDGAFRLQFNAEEGEPALIYFIKPGYSILKKHIVTSGKERKISLGSNTLINLAKAAQINSIQHNPAAVKIGYFNQQPTLYGKKIGLFENKDFTTIADAVAQNDIKYFTKIKQRNRDVFRLHESEDSQLEIPGFWYEVSFVDDRDAERRGYIFSN